MDLVFRGAAVYVFLLLVFRVSGKRSLAQITTFDFILLLIISETTQQAMVGQDFSVTGAFLLVLTLVGLDIALSLWKQRSKKLDNVVESLPLLLLEHGRPLHDRLDKSRMDVTDILAAARKTQGLARLDQIQFAVLERDGSISIIPEEGQES